MGKENWHEVKQLKAKETLKWEGKNEKAPRQGLVQMGGKHCS